MIKIEEISKSFKENKLFEKLSFEIRQGEKICLSADSGKGKSTLIKIILGLESIDSGQVLINNLLLDKNNIAEIRNQIAWLPQDLSLNIQTAEELIEYLTLDEKKLLLFMQKLKLDAQLLKQEYQSLSGGQKQRLLLSACLSLEKPILILDEPTSALDKTAIQDLISTIWQIENLTLISASHNEDWKNACDKILIINE